MRRACSSSSSMEKFLRAFPVAESRNAMVFLLGQSRWVVGRKVPFQKGRLPYSMPRGAWRSDGKIRPEKGTGSQNWSFPGGDSQKCKTQKPRRAGPGRSRPVLRVAHGRSSQAASRELAATVSEIEVELVFERVRHRTDGADLLPLRFRPLMDEFLGKHRAEHQKLAVLRQRGERLVEIPGKELNAVLLRVILNVLLERPEPFLHRI